MNYFLKQRKVRDFSTGISFYRELDLLDRNSHKKLKLLGGHVIILTTIVSNRVTDVKKN